MSFGDIAARLKEKKKQDEAAQAAPVERDHVEVHALRARILGVLLRDALIASEANETDIAKFLNVPLEQVLNWEFGRESPSLPQLEMVAYYLGIPVSHFWNSKTISTEQEERQVPEEQYNELRDRVIGTKLMLARQEAKLSREELAQ